MCVEIYIVSQEPSQDIVLLSCLQEVSFWVNLEQALKSLRARREGVDITLTLDILKRAGRFHATVGFDADTGLTKGTLPLILYLSGTLPLNHRLFSKLILCLSLS